MLIEAGGFYSRKYGITPLMFTVRDTPQDSTGFTPFELLFGHRVTLILTMTLLKHLWTDEKEDPEVKTAYQYVLGLRERIEGTRQLVQEEIAKVQKRNQMYYNRRERRLNIGDSVPLLLPSENSKLTLAWRGPYEVVERVGEVDYRIRVTPDKIETYHINMLKKYHQRKEQRIENDDESQNITESEVSKGGHRIEQVAAIACVTDGRINGNSELEIEDDKELLPLYSVKQKVINPDLSSEQQYEVRSLLREYKEIFSDVPKVTNLIEHKVELTQREPVRCKAYPTLYKMQEIVDKEIVDLLEMGLIVRSEAPYASPLVLVKKPDKTYSMCVNFKESNKITVFDPEPLMSPDDIFPKLAGSKIFLLLI